MRLFLKNIPYAMGDCQEGEPRFSLLTEGFGFPKTLARIGREFEGAFAENSWYRTEIVLGLPTVTKNPD